MKREKSGEVFGAKLGEAVQAMEKWPTPIVTDCTERETLSHWEKRKEEKAQQGINLHKPLRIAVKQQEQIGQEHSQDSMTMDTHESTTMTDSQSSLKPTTQELKLDGQQDQDSPNTSGNNQGQSWATPRTLDASGLMMNTKKRGKEKENTLCGQAANQVKQRKLNPSWVESLMLLPAGYTQLESSDLECSEME